MANQPDRRADGTQAETVPELHVRVRDAVHCHFEDSQAPKMIRLHFVRDEVIAA